MRPLLKSARATGAGLDPAPGAVPARPRLAPRPASLPSAPRRGITFPRLAAASLLIHAAVVGAVIVDYRSSLPEPTEPPAPAIQVDLVKEPPVSLLLHPIDSSAS